MSDVFDLFNESAGDEEVKPQERLVSSNDDFHNHETAPAGDGINMQVTGCKIVDHLSDDRPDGSIEYRITWVDTTEGEYEGQLLTTRVYISRKGNREYNKARFMQLELLGLTKEFMSAQPSLEAQAKHIKAKAAEALVFPYWEASRADQAKNRQREEQGLDPLPVRQFVSNDTYWEVAAGSADAGSLRPKV